MFISFKDVNLYILINSTKKEKDLDQLNLNQQYARVLQTKTQEIIINKKYHLRKNNSFQQNFWFYAEPFSDKLDTLLFYQNWLSTKHTVEQLEVRNQRKNKYIDS